MQNHGWLLLWTHYLVDLHEFVGFVTWCFYAWLQQSWGIVLCCYLVVQLLAFLPCFQKSTLWEEKHFCCNRLPFMDFVRYDCTVITTWEWISTPKDFKVFHFFLIGLEMSSHFPLNYSFWDFENSSTQSWNIAIWSKQLLLIFACFSAFCCKIRQK